ncbi:ABC transporter permease [Candidatus Allofournierella excrementigallinarum]|uniref:ABC transporter permease n=1 Tax=Candidatus Allofournierella excrementigallinarum TaxID=2838592 RepID=UPI00374E49C7
MKAMFLVTWRQWRRGGARTWFVALSALVCSTMLAAVQFGGFSLAVSFKMESAFSQIVLAASQLVVALLVVFLAVLLRGTFAMSLAQRTRMLGQLASVGATRRQLRQSVWLDALFLSALAAPLGVLCAAGGLAVTFRLLRPFMDALAERGVREIHLVITPGAVLLALACPVVTLLLAASGTARRAARLTPIEAVRGMAETPPRRVRRREPRQAPALLASRSVRRAGGRFRTQVSVIVVCALLVCMVNGFSRGLLAGYSSQSATYTYRVYLWAVNIDTRQLLGRLEDTARQVTGVDVWATERTGWRVWEGPARSSVLITLDDESFARWYGGPLPEAQGGLACVYAPPEEGVMAFATGELLNEGTEQALAVADVCTTPLPDGVLWQDTYLAMYPNGVLITSQSAFDALRGAEVTGEDKREFEFFVDAEDSSQLTPALIQTLTELGASERYAGGQTNTGWQIEDLTPASPARVYQKAVRVLLNVFAGGFEVLTALGCGAALLGSIGAETQLRRREFALLRSAGMTRGDVAAMLRRETLLRCAWGLGLGLPAGAALWLCTARWLLGRYMFSQTRTTLLLSVLGCTGAIALGTLLICLAAERATLKAALHSDIRSDLMRE